MSLAELQPGEARRIRAITGGGAVRQRLLDLGLLPETMVRLERVAPVGGPLWIRVGGTQLALRRCEARTIILCAE